MSLPMSRVRQLLPLVPLLLVAVLAGCSEGGSFPQTTFRPTTDYGRALNDTFYNTFWWSMGIMVLVEVLLVYIMFRFREQPNTPHPKPVHGNTKLEILWTVIPAVIVVFIAVPAILTIFRTQRAAPPEALRIEVIGHQWWWEFRYPEQGIVAANEFYVPVGRPVELRLHSADVIHSFWIPRLGGKRDVNPQPAVKEGEHPQTNQILFTPEQPGMFAGQCAEFCGESHAIMRMMVHAVPTDQFDAWVEQMRTGETSGSALVARAQTPGLTAPLGDTTGQVATPAGDSAQQRLQPQVAPPATPAPTPAPTAAQVSAIPAPTGTLPSRPPVPALMTPGAKSDAELGHDIFMTKACVACHSIAGTTAQGAIGPVLTRYGTRPWVGAGAARNNQENLEQWIRSPQSIKPGALMPGALTAAGGMPPTNLTDEEIRLIAAYLLSLK